MYHSGNEYENIERELAVEFGDDKFKEICQDIAEVIRQNKLQHKPDLCRKIFTYLSFVVEGWNCVKSGHEN